MTYFGSWILTHISLVFWLVQLHAIPDHFLENKWWVDDELHFHVHIFLKICTCRTGMNISRKWLDQAPKNIDRYLFFFSFSRLVTCDCFVNLSRTWGSLELPPNGKFFLNQGMLIHVVEILLFNSCIFLKRVATHCNTHVEPKKYGDLCQPCF